MGGVVHPLLQSTIGVGKDRGATTEAHAFAKVIATLLAEIAIPTVDACLDGDTLTGDEIFDTWADCSDDAGCFVAKNQGSLDSKITVPSMAVVVHWARLRVDG